MNAGIPISVDSKISDLKNVIAGGMMCLIIDF